ncbi:unnamed protein product [Closterium sp. NIES-64]|nr:unnamed protein product [Closterium sp. NIES-64]
MLLARRLSSPPCSLRLPSLPRLAPLLLLLLLAAPHLPPSLAQSQSPLSGQGLAPYPTLLTPPGRNGQGERRALQMEGGGTCASAGGGEPAVRAAYTPVFVSVVLNKLLDVRHTARAPPCAPSPPCPRPLPASANLSDPLPSSPPFPLRPPSLFAPPPPPPLPLSPCPPLPHRAQVDDERYQFEAIVHLRMSWHDPRAPLEIRRRTAETFLAGNPSACARVCAKGRSLCCDSLWLPGVMGGNLLSLEDERTEWEAIALQPGNHSNVRWGRRLRATFHAALRFHRYPFDTQQLVVELWAESCCYSFVPSAAAIRRPRSLLPSAHAPSHLHDSASPSVTSGSSRGSMGRRGEQSGADGASRSRVRRGRVRRDDGSGPDDLSGWQVESVYVQAQATHVGRMMQWVEEPHADEVFCVRSEELAGATLGGGGTPCGTMLWEGEEGGEEVGGKEEEGEEAGECGSGRVESSEWRAWQEREQQLAAASLNSTLLIVIRVQRIWHYYLFLFLLPTFLAVALSWTSFCMSPEHLELRVGTGVTLFLALTSHQFVIFDTLPHSSYVTIMGWFIIWSYALIVFAVLQSLLVNYVYCIGETAAREHNESVAARATRRLLMGSAGAVGRAASGSRDVHARRWPSLSPQALSLLWRPSASIVAAAAEPLLAQEGPVGGGEGGGRRGESSKDAAGSGGRKGGEEGKEAGREGLKDGKREGEGLGGVERVTERSVLGDAGKSESKPPQHTASGGVRSGDLVSSDKPCAPVIRPCGGLRDQESEGEAVSQQPTEQENESEMGAEKVNRRGVLSESESFAGLSHLSKRIQETVAQAGHLKGMVEQDPNRAKIFISRLDGLCLVAMPLLYVGGLLWIYMVVE